MAAKSAKKTRHSAAEATLREAVDRMRRLPESVQVDMAHFPNDLGLVLRDKGEQAGAEKLMRAHVQHFEDAMARVLLPA